MKGIRFLLLVLVLALPAYATDINPTRRVVPERFTNPPGKRFSIFAGDPERVQRANEVNVEDFKASLKVEKEYSLAQLQSVAEKKPSLDVVFAIHNTGKRSYTLSFPDSQRYDVMIQDEKGSVFYIWSRDKAFVKKVGKIFMNADERISFRPNPAINLAPLLIKLQPGTYQVTAALSNYPEIQAKTEWVLKP